MLVYSSEKLFECVVLGGFWGPYVTFVSISLGYGIVAGGIVAFISPLAAGSGIAEVKTYLNGVHIRGLLTVSKLRGRSPVGLQNGLNAFVDFLNLGNEQFPMIDAFLYTPAI